MRDFVCPWRGPLPYEERDSQQFFGRKKELVRLLRLINLHALTVLTAQSGVGKSSLIQAGIVPELRLRRDNAGDIGPVLVLRSWQRQKDVSTAALILESVRRSIEDLGEIREVSYYRKLSNDVDLLLGTRPARLPRAYRTRAHNARATNVLLEYLNKLRQATEGLVIIFDQAEELLGSAFGRPNLDTEREVLQVVGRVFQEQKRDRRSKIVISLREEYLGRLKPLERYVSGLERRQARLDPMPARTAVDVVAESASLSEQVELRREDAGLIVSWLSGMPSHDATSESVDLLRMQAVLVTLFEYAVKHSGKASRVRIDKDMLLSFQAGRDGGVLAKESLENYIEGILAGAETTHPSTSEEPIGVDLLRRLVARMAPWLSAAGGFKRYVQREDLILNSIRNDIDTLGKHGSDDDVRSWLREYLEDERKVFIREGDFRSSQDSWQAGIARRHGYSRETAAMTLADAAKMSLETLTDNAVLKCSSSDAGTVYELVHDGFGPALMEWAERFKNTLTFARASVTSINGETFRWNERVCPAEGDEKMVVENVAWLGCSLEEITFENVEFRDCHLSGAIFINCVFINCSFTSCDMKGVVFRGGALENTDWVDCRGNSALFVSSRWSHVQFRGCVLENSTVVGISLAGLLSAVDTTFGFSQIRKFFMARNARISFVDCDFLNALFEDGEAWPPKGESRLTNVIYEDLGALAARKLMP